MSAMEFEILDALDDLRYAVKVDENGLKALVKDTSQFSKLLQWICQELKACSSLEESVTAVENQDDLSSFHMELSSLLNELGCHYLPLMNGSMSERFSSDENRIMLLNFLLGELQASRIAYVRNTKKVQVEVSESPTAKLLREMLQTLGIPKPPGGVSTKALLSKINDRLSEILSKMPPKLLDKPFLVGTLSEKQWAHLEDLNKQFQQEYRLRREMLLKRLDVTVQSFHWSDRLKNKKDEINKIFRARRDTMIPNPAVEISDILAARSDLAIIEKTSSARVRMNTKSSVNTVVIGKVPDRGGRPNEAQPPPPEMPPWQQRQGAPAGGHGWSQGSQPQRDYGEGRGPRGGGQQRPKVQGGWSDHGSNYQQQQQQQQPHYQPQQPQYANYQQNIQPVQQSYGGGQNYNQGGGGGHYQDRSGGYGDKGGGSGGHDRNYQGNQGGYQGRNQGDNYYQGGGGGGGGGGYRGGGGHRGGRGGGRGSRHQY